MRLKRKEFTINIHRPGYHDSPEQVPPTLDLPARPEELLDLLDRARINDSLLSYDIEITYSHHPYLFHYLETQPLNLYELNHLANNLADLKKDESIIFEGLVKMEAAPISVERLINLTHTINEAVLAHGISSDYEYGQWSFENDFIEELTGISDNAAQYLDFAKIGKERRMAEHGVFTVQGYLANLNWPDISNVYDPQKLATLEETLPADGLIVRFFRYDLAKQEASGQSIRKSLPLSDNEYRLMLDKLCCTEDELTVIPEYSLVPSMKESISETESIGTLNAFAVCARGLYEMGKLPLYKAVLEATECVSLTHAAGLGARIHEYRLDTSLTDSAQYARKELEEKLGYDEAASMAEVQDLLHYGQNLLGKNNVSVTEYGYLTRVDGEPIMTCAQMDEQAYEHTKSEFEQIM